MRGLRLAVYCESSTLGGAEESLGNLLAALDPQVDVTVVGVDQAVVAMLAARRPGVRTRVVRRVRGKGDLPAVAGHIRALLAIRPHVLQVSLATPWSGQYAILAGLLTPGARVVVVEHLPLRLTHRLQRTLRRWLLARIDAHVCVGERSARMAETFLGVAPGSVRTIHNGIFDLPPDPIPRLAAGPTIGWLGRLAPEKGLDVLVRALPALPGVTAVLVGEGRERARLEGLAREVGVEDRLILTGWRDDARRCLGAFDLVVLPSRAEAHPLAAIEAMLAELPVVASDVGSVSETVSHGETGLLVPPGDVEALADAISTLLADGERRRAMGKAGRARALERFTASRMAREYEALYEELTAGS